MQGTIKIECKETGEHEVIDIECKMQGTREDSFRVLNSLATEAFRMTDEDFMLFMWWRNARGKKENKTAIKVDKSEMHREEEK